MQTTNEFTVPLGPERAWVVLTDLERVAPCLPGARITAVDGDDYEGRAKIKIGPITAEYKGVARFESRDDTAHRAVIRATGKDLRGQGTVGATITAHLDGAEDTSTVTVVTDLDITGKVAQFGRGVIADTSAALFRTFADRLATEMVDGTATTPTSGPGLPETTDPVDCHVSAPPADDALDVLKLARSVRAGDSTDRSMILSIPLVTSALAALTAFFAAVCAVQTARVLKRS